MSDKSKKALTVLFKVLIAAGALAHALESIVSLVKPLFS